MSEEPIEYIIAQPEHEKPIYDYLQKHQRVQEPTMTAAKCTEEDLHPFMASLAEICSKNGVSYLALNVQQEIIGIRLNAPLQAWNDMMNAPPTEPPTERAQVTYDYVHVLENGYEKLMPNTCEFVVIVSAERLWVVIFPLKAHCIRTRHLVSAILVTWICSFALTFNFHIQNEWGIKTNQHNRTTADIVENLYPAYSRWSIILQLFLQILIPVTVLFFINTVLVYHLSRHHRLFRHVTDDESKATEMDHLTSIKNSTSDEIRIRLNNTDSPEETPRKHQSNHLDVIEQRRKRVTVLVCAISVCFVLSHIPSAVGGLQDLYFKGRRRPLYYYYLAALTNTLVVVGKSLNFILFCILSSSFRSRLISMCHRSRLWHPIFEFLKSHHDDKDQVNRDVGKSLPMSPRSPVVAAGQTEMNTVRSPMCGRNHEVENGHGPKGALIVTDTLKVPTAADVRKSRKSLGIAKSMKRTIIRRQKSVDGELKAAYATINTGTR